MQWSKLHIEKLAAPIAEQLPFVSPLHIKEQLAKLKKPTIGEVRNCSAKEMLNSGMDMPIVQALQCNIEHTKPKEENEFYKYHSEQQILEYFQTMYPNNDQRQVPHLESKFGWDWPFFGREQIGQQMLTMLANRYEKRNTLQGKDRWTNPIPWLTGMQGTGMTALNENMLPLMQRLVSKDAPFYQQLQDCVKVMISFSNETALTIDEQLHLKKCPFHIGVCMGHRALFWYFVQGKQQQGNGAVTFSHFLEVMRKQFPNLGLRQALDTIALDQRKHHGISRKQLFIYLGIDNCEHLRKEELEEVAADLGSILCTAMDTMLIPMVTGSDFHKIFTSFVRRYAHRHLCSFTLLPQSDINKTLDSLATKYKVLSFWRLWTDFRVHLEYLDGYMYGISLLIKKLVNDHPMMEIDNADSYLRYVDRNINVATYYDAIKELIRDTVISSNSFDAATVVQAARTNKEIHRIIQADKPNYDELATKGILLLTTTNRATNRVAMPFVFQSILAEKYSIQHVHMKSCLYELPLTCMNETYETNLLKMPGIEKELATQIVNERKRSPFTSWQEFVTRVPQFPVELHLESNKPIPAEEERKW